MVFQIWFSGDILCFLMLGPHKLLLNLYRGMTQEFCGVEAAVTVSMYTVLLRLVVGR